MLFAKALRYVFPWRVTYKGTRMKFKGELRPEISLLHMKVLTLIKEKSSVFLRYVQCCSCTRWSKTKILTTRAPPSWIEFDVVTSHRQMPHLEYGLWLLISMFLCLLILIGRLFDYLIGSTLSLTLWRHNVKLNPRWRRPSCQYFGFRSSHAATALHVSKKNTTFFFNQG